MSHSVKPVDETDFLLIGGGFFGYANEIVSELVKRGRRPVWFEDRPALDFVTKGLLRVAPWVIAPKAEAYFDKVIADVRGAKIRDVLVIKGESLSVDAIRRMRAALPHARFTLYFWDSYGNMPPDSRDKVGLFDRVFSFDPLDVAADSRLKYRPLFYLGDYASLPKLTPTSDLLFVGTVHSDRYKVLKKISKSLPESVRFEKVMYCASTSVYYMRKLLDPVFMDSRPKDFIFSPLSKAQMQALISRARVVLDIERSVQAGFTMRTMEMFGAGKKLISTNAQILKADFYHKNNMAVIDRDSPVFPLEFLDAPYVEPVRSTLERYSLSGWLDEVIGR